MQRYTRRSTLAALAGITTLSGCVGGDRSGPSGTDDARAGSTPTPAGADEAPIWILRTRVGRSTSYLEYPDLVGVTYADGGAFVFVKLQVTEGTAPSRGAFSLAVGDVTAPSTDEFGAASLFDATQDPYTAEEGAGFVGFTLPQLEETAQPTLNVRVESRRYRLGLPMRVATVATQDIDLAIESLDLPATVPRDGVTTGTVTVRNRGPDPGTFHARLKPRSTSMTGVSFVKETVPAETTRELDVRVSAPDPGIEGQPFDPGTTLTYRLAWRDEHVDQDVRIEAPAE